MPASAAREEPRRLVLAIAHGAIHAAAGDSGTPHARSIGSFSYASVIAPTLIITRTLIEQSKILVKANVAFPHRCSRLPQRPPPATGPFDRFRIEAVAGRSQSSTAGVC